MEPENIGSRYDEAKKLIPQLIWCGYSGEEVFQMLRNKYSRSYTDSQLWSTIRWAQRTVTPRESDSSKFRPRRVSSRKFRKPAEPEIDLDGLLATVSVSGCQPCPYDFFEKSPIRLEDPDIDQRLIIEYLFKQGELVALTGAYKEADKVKTKEDWLAYLGTNPAPQSNSGGWFYANPVKSSHGRHITNQDIAEFRHILLDGDFLTKDNQLKLLGSVIPSISAIVDTGNRGYHALVRIDAKDREEYTRRAGEMFSMLKALKFDPATKLPYCKCRMPNIHRVEKDKGVDGWQKLIYLNPNPTSDAIFPMEGGSSND